MENNNSKLNTILLIVIIILLVVGIGSFTFFKKTPAGQLEEGNVSNNQQETLTDSSNDQDAYVPAKAQASTPTFSPLTTTYITAQNWPPKISTTTETAICPGIPGPRMINGKMYCVDTHLDAAAGSIFTDFIYHTGTTEIMFTLRFSRCDNYDNAEKSACELERAKFNPDQIIIDANL